MPEPVSVCYSFSMKGSTMTECNGFSNYPTWNVCLYLQNDKNRMDTVNAFVQHGRDKDVIAAQIARYARRIWPSGKTIDGCKLSEANFAEIAEHFIAD
jgi:hypothetical protein